MEKEFVPYEQSLALKELGFDEPCFSYYYNRELSFGVRTSYGEVVEAPTFSQAFRWFREKYGDYLLYSFGLIPHFTIIQNLIIEDSKTTYEEAELECLKKLIEIVKEK